MTDIKTRLTEAADHLDWLYEGSKHIPTDMTRDRNFRVGTVRTQQTEVALFFYGGAADVFLTLGPAVLPLLAMTLRKTAAEHSGVPSKTVMAALALTDHILKAKEKQS